MSGGRDASEHPLRVYAGRWFVLKVGGELAGDRARLAATVGRSISGLLDAGIKVAVVHGAGPQATDLSTRLGIEPTVIAGRRVTDEATLEVMKMTLAGVVSVEIASAFRLAGVPAIATTGVSAGIVEAVRRPPKRITGGGPDPVDLGWVGDVTRVNVGLLERLAAADVVPVIASLSADDDGNVYNINADTVATRIATAARAAKLLLVSNVPGVLRDPADPTTRLPHLSPDEARARIADGSIRGGMIPKVEAALAALDDGIESVHLVGLDPEHAIVEEAVWPGRWGTAFVREAP